MIEIPLTRGYFAKVDDADAASVLSVRQTARSPAGWSASVKPDGAVYALCGFKRDDGVWTTIRMHNFITGWRFVDHINGDGLDNRRANLRPATHASNNRNRGGTRLNTSGYKGVTWHKRGRKWMAQIHHKGKHYHLGLFTDLTEAALAYDVAAADMFGEFAWLNFPQEKSA